MDNGHIMATFAGPQLFKFTAPQDSVSTDASSIVATGSRKRCASSVALPRQGAASSTGAARPTKTPRRHQAMQRPARNMNRDNQSQTASVGLPANLPSAGANNSAGVRQRQSSALPAQALQVTRRSRLFDLLSAGLEEEEDEPGSIVPDSARRGARRRPRARPLPPLDPLSDTPHAALQTEDATAPAQAIVAPLLQSALAPLTRPTPSVPPTTTTTTAPRFRRATRKSREEPPYEAVENTFLRSLNERCVGLAPRDVPTDKSLVEEFNNRFAGTQLTVRDEHGGHRLTEPRPTRTKAAITSHVRREGFWADIKRVRAEGRGWKPGPKLGSKKRSMAEMEGEEKKKKEKKKGEEE
ncbi:hypothetical protein MPH_05990 [Macrophomina phaseolina MS6]|uniref:Uncharacterized protein n=1 Tax=Macrophomina phaseolina (strain MS6) TaxID=1126212 RepID=K2RVN9_MACPH|nr:hypothetical protein MPH_05990 [Macrophomina phaseolina MS6]